MRLLLLTTVAGLALSPFAYAQTMKAPAPKNENVQQQVKANLQQAGFTDIKIRPESFLINAKDKSGNPVTISVDPNSIEEVTMYQDQSPSASNQSATQNSSTGMFTTVPSNDKLSSNLVGLNVYNNANQDIGKIKDVSVDQNGVRAYILAVGGFLGMGDRYVAVNPSAVKVIYNDSDKKWHATMDANADQLKSAPEFKYTGPWEASKS